MRPLVLCQTCKRHVKGSDPACPFCGTAVRAAPGQAAVRARGLPGGRAALFLAGSVLAPGCADELDPAGTNGQHDGTDSGAPDGGHDAGDMMAVAVYGIAIDSGVFIAPPYGIAIPDDTGAPDAALNDAGCPQIGNLPVPVYGVPVDSGRPANLCTDAGQDAGKDAGPRAIPAYGIAIDPHQ